MDRARRLHHHDDSTTGRRGRLLVVMITIALLVGAWPMFGQRAVAAPDDAFPTRTDRWMADYGEVVGQRLLRQLVIPGTHDSGTASLDDPAPYLNPRETGLAALNALISSPDSVLDLWKIEDPFARALLYPVAEWVNGIVGRILGEIMADWSITQDQSLRQQLDDGIRYFDLRFCWDEQRGQFRVCHSVYGQEMMEALHEIDSFYDQPGHEREILILDLGTPHATSDESKSILSAVHSVFGDRLVDSSRSKQLDTLTVDDLWRDGKQIVVLSDNECAKNDDCFADWSPWHRGDSTYGPWNSVIGPDGVVRYTDEMLVDPAVIEERMELALQYRPESKLLVLGTATTPSQDYLIDNVVSCLVEPIRNDIVFGGLIKLLEDLGAIHPHDACSLLELGAQRRAQSNLLMTWWATNQMSARRNMNIVNVDNYRASAVVEYAIRMNAGPVINFEHVAGGAPYTPPEWTGATVATTARCATSPTLDLPFPVLDPPASTSSSIEEVTLQVVAQSGSGERQATVVTGGHTVDGKVSATCVDEYGKQARASGASIFIDKTPPSVSNIQNAPVPNVNGWNSSDVVVSWNCADADSGPAAPSGSQVASSEGAAQRVLATCVDLVGNRHAVPAVPINLDRTAPHIELTGRTEPNDLGWNDEPVTVSWRCIDALSGPEQEHDSVTVGSEGVAQTAIGVCADRAGNGSRIDVFPINIDLTIPLVAARATTADGAAYAAGTWTSQDVTVEFLCGDALSGVRDVTAPITVRSEGADQRADGTCSDNAGNRADASFGDIDIDKTAPITTADLHGPRSSSGWHTGAVTVSLDASDALSGVAATTYRVDGGEMLPYTGPFVIAEAGKHTVRFTSTDVAGNVEGERSVEIQIQPYALFAGRTACSGTALTWSGSDAAVTGNVHSNGGMRLSGSRNETAGVGSARCSVNVSGNGNEFTEGPEAVETVADWPLALGSSDLPCTHSKTGTFALSADGPWWVGGSKSSGQLADGVLCATGPNGLITLSGTGITGNVTLVAPRVVVSGNGHELTAYEDGVLALATGAASTALKVSGHSTDLTGVLMAPAGGIELSGAQNQVTGSVLGDTVKLSGHAWVIDSTGVRI